jgi:hypothetical protein
MNGHAVLAKMVYSRLMFSYRPLQLDLSVQSCIQHVFVQSCYLHFYVR